MLSASVSMLKKSSLSEDQNNRNSHFLLVLFDFMVVLFNILEIDFSVSGRVFSEFTVGD